MQDKQISIPDNEEHSLSLRTQRLINYLEDLWKRPYQPSSEILKGITEFLTQLPEPYQMIGMTKIAEYFVSRMGLHFLDIMTTFQRKAENEGISGEERIQTIQGTMPELFLDMMGLSKEVYIRSLDDLVTLGNITFSLYTLSQVSTAEEAQNWMYELPILYRRQLAQERLLANIQAHFVITMEAK